jgi:hypothetical protein
MSKESNNGKENPDLTFGLSEDIYKETHRLREALKEIALSKAPEKNPCRFKEPTLRFFSNLWFYQRKTASASQKDSVGIAYIAFALGLGKEVAEKFKNGDIKAYEIVKEIQADPPEDADFRPFWEEVQRIFPGIYSDIDISCLSNFSIEMPDHMLMQLDLTFAEDSPVLDALKVSLHLYK